MDEHSVPLGFVRLPSLDGEVFLQRSAIYMILPNPEGCAIYVGDHWVQTQLTCEQALARIQTQADADQKQSMALMNNQAQKMVEVSKAVAVEAADALDLAAARREQENGS